MKMLEAYQILSDFSEQVKIKKGYDLWTDVDNLFLRRTYTTKYFRVKHIEKVVKSKKTGLPMPRNYIYYYERYQRDKISSEQRKADGKVNNNYAKDIYHGTPTAFTLVYDSYMQDLADDGYIIELGNGAIQLHSNLIMRMIEDFPELLEKPVMITLLEEIEELNRDEE
jgi:hypothetical protein